MTPIATPARGGPARGSHGWQLILADLALILFLLTLSALPSSDAEAGRRLATAELRERGTRQQQRAEVAAAQALFRPVPGGPALGEWLSDQQPDPRATLTIFAVHAPGREAAAWRSAEALAAEARARGARVRTIISAGTADAVYASLAYDEAVADGGGAGERTS